MQTSNIFNIVKSIKAWYILALVQSHNGYGPMTVDLDDEVI